MKRDVECSTPAWGDDGELWRCPCCHQWWECVSSNIDCPSFEALWERRGWLRVHLLMRYQMRRFWERRESLKIIGAIGAD